VATALNAFMKIGEAEGESKQAPYDKPPWIEIQAWDWEVEAETSWTKGGGAAVGKPSPGKMNWEHNFDRASNIILSFICTGKSFSKIELQMCKSTGDKGRMPFFTVVMTEAFITKVNQSATEEGNVLQKVEMVFKTIEIQYSQQGLNANNPGALQNVGTFKWDIPAGEASPDKDGS
jgi:type VI secretion system secreted protein Hcp